MEKLFWKPGTMIYPLPAVMVSCGTEPSQFNIITLSWTGTICTDPAMCYISVRPERHSYNIIRQSGCYVINLTNARLAKATDWCGVRSGRDFDKFRETGLTPVPASTVNAPMIEESPVNIECIVKDVIELGSHHMFISDVAAVHADPQYYDQKTGLFKLAGSGLISYVHGRYCETGKIIGRFGYSVERKRKTNRKKGKTSRD
ncbi:MAG TPA: flavin reductase family protein [Bacteroidales bacterium]|nr:flavin reductase family protein [Bacteroidales bacterium]HPF02863.1 flavin reductase family protein [Bacteroidales bacterium]HPJ60326.1 flavin reductase family protein [Bacteroidales bacterium]HPR10770.1 flavin reductase family protein [Bacteroidales bacterium]HRW86677.1 flavin reductase family protein [Bacteroidales bacterium]